MKLKRRQLAFVKIKYRCLGFFFPRLVAKKAFTLFCTPPSGKQIVKAPTLFSKADQVQLPFENGLVLRGWKWSPESPSGKTVLVAHGFDSHSFKFEKYIRPLLKNRFTVLAFDAPGHGLSDGRTINSLQYSRAMLQIDKDFGGLYGIIGHSMAALAASLASEKLPLLSRLVIIAPSVEITRPIDSFCEKLSLAKRVRSKIYQLVEKIAQEPVSFFHVGRALKEIKIPTLWIHDTMDQVCPIEEALKTFKLGLPHIKSFITEGLGHSKVYRDDKSIKEVVSFLIEEACFSVATF